MMVRLLAIVPCAGLFAALALALLERPAPGVDLPAQVAARLPDSGVDHPITAVLLNFRSFDTLLEIAVLLLAAVVALALYDSQTDRPDGMGLANPLLRAVMSWLLPLMLLVAGYLLWAGSTRPGGAFQAGAVMAAVGVLLHLAGVSLGSAERRWIMRGLLVSGLAVFIAAGTVPVLTGNTFLAWPDGWAKAMIFSVECVLTLSIAAALLSLFRLAPPHAQGEDTR